MSNTDLCFLSATRLAKRIASRDLSALEVTNAHLAQIERCNPQVNAIVTLVAEQAQAAAKAAVDVITDDDEDDEKKDKKK